jgi:hypothetical protein
MRVWELEGSRAVRDLRYSPRIHREPPPTHPTWKATTEEQDPQKGYPEAGSPDLPGRPTL